MYLILNRLQQEQRGEVIVNRHSDLLSIMIHLNRSRFLTARPEDCVRDGDNRVAMVERGCREQRAAAEFGDHSAAGAGDRLSFRHCVDDLQGSIERSASPSESGLEFGAPDTLLGDIGE
jgi:hypothetical protein